MAILAPGIVALITLVFTLRLARVYGTRRRPHHLFWAVSMAQACLASAAYLISAALGGVPLLFKVYYALGALMVASYLGLGSIYLVAGPGLARASLGFVLVLTVLGTVGIFAAPVNMDVLATLNGGAGQGVLGSKGLWLPQLIAMNTFGTVGVVVPALVSVGRVARRGERQSGAAGVEQLARGRATALGTVLIAAGVLVNAAAGTAARLGTGGFWLTMVAGYALMFAGLTGVARAEERRPA